MTATDELRRMLDERGVEWEDHGYPNHTWWIDGNGVCWHAENRPTTDGVFLKIEAVLTPEQAIAATLGRGTCHRRPHINLTIGDNFLKQSGWDCSECGCRLDLPVIARYCPNCGCKIKKD